MKVLDITSRLLNRKAVAEAVRRAGLVGRWSSDAEVPKYVLVVRSRDIQPPDFGIRYYGPYESVTEAKQVHFRLRAYPNYVCGQIHDLQQFEEEKHDGTSTR